jgi:hypothetical protein
MDRLLLLSVLASAVFNIAADDMKLPDGFREFSPKDGSFTVFIPDQKTTKATEKDGGMPAVKGLKTKKTFKFDSKGLNAGITTYEPTDGALKSATPPDRLKTVRDTLVKSLKGELGDDKDIKLAEKWDGREFHVKADKDVHRIRLYDVNGTLYRVQFTGTADQAAGKTAGLFLNSFKLAEKKD